MSGATTSGAATSEASRCPLCNGAGGDRIWHDSSLRVILPDEPGYPGFTRVVWRQHVAEMTDLSPAERDHLMSVVWRVEAAQRETLAPDKINLACLGNMTPHLHWHVIPRWRDDRHFPESVWGRPAKGRDPAMARRRLAALACLPDYLERLRREFD
jgi:diadenosine tetraphosphate (Ap4A) HIT family hydrolase